MISPHDLMRHAIAAARQGIADGQSPFGCAIACGDELIAVEHNLVLATTDITAHAEITALRSACRQRRAIHLVGCIVASTCEPCPMCMAALHWARVDAVYFGATIADAAHAGFNELAIPAEEVLRRGRSQVRLVPEILPAECQALFGEFIRRPAHRVY
ncbi:MAG: nucleoside deaminase [Pirellulaceae bacterium]